MNVRLIRSGRLTRCGKYRGAQGSYAHIDISVIDEYITAALGEDGAVTPRPWPGRQSLREGARSPLREECR
jgi:hypothetical protein